VATLRDYLSCEYKKQFPDMPARQYTKLNMLGHIVKVPQQLNFTDCGLFLLQYVENFFKIPIGDFRFPIKSLINWFPQDVVTRKREDISILIKKIMEEQNVKDVELPKLEFPTLDGKILEPAVLEASQEALEDAFGDEIAGDEDYVPAEEEIKESESVSPQKKVYVSSKKRSLDSNESNGSEESTTKTSKKCKS
jgi:sentrin-specific protease 7